MTSPAAARQSKPGIFAPSWEKVLYKAGGRQDCLRAGCGIRAERPCPNHVSKSGAAPRISAAAPIDLACLRDTIVTDPEPAPQAPYGAAFLIASRFAVSRFLKGCSAAEASRGRVDARLHLLNSLLLA